MNWLRQLFHLHKWVMKSGGNIVVYEDGRKIITGFYRDCECEVCGSWRIFRHLA